MEGLTKNWNSYGCGNVYRRILVQNCRLLPSLAEHDAFVAVAFQDSQSHTSMVDHDACDVRKSIVN